jgi:hypothetical protein
MREEEKILGLPVLGKGPQWLAVGMYLILIAYLVWDSLRAKK